MPNPIDPGTAESWLWDTEVLDIPRPLGTNTGTMEFWLWDTESFDVYAGELRYQQSLTGALTSSGTLTKEPQKPLAGTLTSSGALTKEPQRALTGVLTSSGTLTHLLALHRSLDGVLSFSGTYIS